MSKESKEGREKFKTTRANLHLFALVAAARCSRMVHKKGGETSK